MQSAGSRLPHSQILNWISRGNFAELLEIFPALIVAGIKLGDDTHMIMIVVLPIGGKTTAGFNIVMEQGVFKLRHSDKKRDVGFFHVGEGGA